MALIKTVRKEVKRPRNRSILRNWDNGLRTRTQISINHGFWIERGYICLCKDRRNYPIYEHRLVMEKLLGRTLETTEIVHHIDGNKQHNDHSNLVILTKGKHSAYHNKHRHDQWIKERTKNNA